MSTIIAPATGRITAPHAAQPSAAASASALHGARGCDFIASTNQLVFVEGNGNITLYNLFEPAGATVSSGTITLKGTWSFDCESGTLPAAQTDLTADIWWSQWTNTHREMIPQHGARIVNLGAVDFDALGSASLQALTYGTTPINGDDNAANQLVAGDVFAVQTNAGNFCKIKVLSYGYNMQIQWVTYAVGSRYSVIGTGYNQPSDIVVLPDGRHAYVTEGAGNVLAVDLTNANRTAANVVASGLSSPSQMQFDAVHASVYVVEAAANGRLLKIPLAGGAPVAIASNLDHPVGLALSFDEQSAYVTQQAADGGHVRRVDLGTGAVSDLPGVGTFTAPFMMAWVDPGRERLAVCEGSPQNGIAIVDLTNGNTVTRITAGVAPAPADLAFIAPDRALVTSDATISDVRFGLDALTGPLYKGIGFVPFDRIDAVTGLANTWGDAAYFYRVQNVPFGGVLPVKINHYLASLDGAKWYQILIDGLPRGDSFADYLWNIATSRYDTVVVTPQTVGALTNVYPVRNLADLVLYFNSDLGGMVDTTGYVDGIHHIEVKLYNAAGNAIPIAAPNGGPHTIRFDNSRCFASLDSISANGGNAGLECGILKYAMLTDNVTSTYRASQANNSATYSFRVLRGANEIVSLEQGGTVGTPSYSEIATAGVLLGKCAAPAGPGVAGFLEDLYVATRAINGVGRCSQYDASDARAFVLSM